MNKSTPENGTGVKLIKSDNQFPVVGIGASAGGLDAFRKLVNAIPVESGMAYVLVQHLDPNHESLLPELLQKATQIPVLEISDDIAVKPDHIYVIPGNKMLVATDGVLKLSPRPAKSTTSLNLPIDLFFSSLAEIHREQSIGVVLSGTASDGTKGLKAIRDAGGITFAQDEDSAEYNGMPGSAVQAGIVDFILSPDKIPQKLMEIKDRIIISDEDLTTTAFADEDSFKQILTLLRVRKGTDFTYYKQTTIRRRIFRRMALNKKEIATEYLKYLREHKTEQDALYQDLLIPVTSFFRDPKVFETLCESVFPHILKNKKSEEPFRIWIAGCSTGEETYSMAICIKEMLGQREGHIQIFATDISEPAISKARRGIYSKAETDCLSPKRLSENFTKSDGHYRINKDIKDLCIFAVHNFLKDPPFGKIDLVSCRNVLIYMESYLQKKALTTFHYALNPKGFLLLGKSETGSSVPELFETADKTYKIFMRKDIPGRYMQIMTRQKEQQRNNRDIDDKSYTPETDFQKTADEILLSKYTPVGVVVNDAMDIVHFRGNTAPFLEQASGKPSHNLFRMAKEGLGFEIRNILHKVKKEQKALIKENIVVGTGSAVQSVTIEAIPLPNMADPHYLLMFHPQTTKMPSGKLKKIKAVPGAADDEKDNRIVQLESELSRAREDMRNITEDQEAANEELQSANEELLSSSEELQSLNEELETGKEELQSINEELMVVNQEMVGLNEGVSEARDYAEAIIATVREPLVVLDKNLCVKMATASFYKTFAVTEKETEHRSIYDIGDHQWDIPEFRYLLERVFPEKTTIRDFEVTYHFKRLGERTILLNAREIQRSGKNEKLILLTMSDITDVRVVEKNLQQSELKFRRLADFMPQKVWTADALGNIDYFNENWYSFSGLSFSDLKFWGWKKVIHPDDWEENQKKWMHSVETGENFEMEHRFLDKNDRYVWHLTRGVAHKDETGKVVMWVGTNTEIQDQKQQTQVLEKAVAERTKELEDANEALQQKNQEIAISRYNKRFLLEFSEKFSSYKAHHEFFNAVVQYIADLTHLDYVFVGKLEHHADDGDLIHTIALNAFGKLAGNITYALPDGPCEEVMRGELYVYPDKCRTIFPKNKTIAQFEVEGYIGYPLYDGNGTAIGLIAAMHGQEIEDPETVSSVLKIVAKRAEIELERIRYEELLQKNNKSLADKNEELVKMNKELESFTYISSHDLQEPLRKIQTFANLILTKEQENLSDAGKDAFRRMQAAGARMQLLIEDLLAFSRINTTERTFENTNLQNIYDEVRTEIADRIKDRNVQIETDLNRVAKIIPFQFRQLFNNLITNSIKFCPTGRDPHIVITSSAVDGSQLTWMPESLQRGLIQISFRDNGIGFDPEYKDRIFELFQRLHGKEEYKGTGIGLAIVKKIVENHSGLIKATGILGEGAIFDIYIPA